MVAAVDPVPTRCLEGLDTGPGLKAVDDAFPAPSTDDHAHPSRAVEELVRERLHRGGAEKGKLPAITISEKVVVQRGVAAHEVLHVGFVNGDIPSAERAVHGNASAADTGVLPPLGPIGEVVGRLGEIGGLD